RTAAEDCSMARRPTLMKEGMLPPSPPAEGRGEGVSDPGDRRASRHDDVAQRATRDGAVERIAGHQCQAIVPGVEKHAYVAVAHDFDTRYDVVRQAPVRGLHLERVAGAQVAQEGEMRVAMTTDDCVSAVARQRRAVHVPRPEREG